MQQFVGWSLCINNEELGESVSDLWSAFGADAELLERLGLQENTYLQEMVGSANPRNRKRDRGLDVYSRLFPEGHEAQGKSLKEATNAVSDALGQVVSVDTMRRALGKKK